MHSLAAIRNVANVGYLRVPAGTTIPFSYGISTRKMDVPRLNTTISQLLRVLVFIRWKYPFSQGAQDPSDSQKRDRYTLSSPSPKQPVHLEFPSNRLDSQKYRAHDYRGIVSRMNAANKEKTLRWPNVLSLLTHDKSRQIYAIPGTHV